MRQYFSVLRDNPIGRKYRKSGCFSPFMSCFEPVPPVTFKDSWAVYRWAVNTYEEYDYGIFLIDLFFLGVSFTDMI